MPKRKKEESKGLGKRGTSASSSVALLKLNKEVTPVLNEEIAFVGEKPYEGPLIRSYLREGMRPQEEMESIIEFFMDLGRDVARDLGMLRNLTFYDEGGVDREALEDYANEVNRFLVDLVGIIGSLAYLDSLLLSLSMERFVPGLKSEDSNPMFMLGEITEGLEKFLSGREREIRDMVLEHCRWIFNFFQGLIDRGEVGYGRENKVMIVTFWQKLPLYLKDLWREYVDMCGGDSGLMRKTYPLFRELSIEDTRLGIEEFLRQIFSSPEMRKTRYGFGVSGKGNDIHGDIWTSYFHSFFLVLNGLKEGEMEDDWDFWEDGSGCFVKTFWYGTSGYNKWRVNTRRIWDNGLNESSLRFSERVFPNFSRFLREIKSVRGEGGERERSLDNRCFSLLEKLFQNEGALRELFGSSILEFFLKCEVSWDKTEIDRTLFFIPLVKDWELSLFGEGSEDSLNRFCIPFSGGYVVNDEYAISLFSLAEYALGCKSSVTLDFMKKILPEDKKLRDKLLKLDDGFISGLVRPLNEPIGKGDGFLLMSPDNIYLSMGIISRPSLDTETFPFSNVGDDVFLSLSKYTLNAEDYFIPSKMDNELISKSGSPIKRTKIWSSMTRRSWLVNLLFDENLREFLRELAELERNKVRAFSDIDRVNGVLSPIRRVKIGPSIYLESELRGKVYFKHPFFHSLTSALEKMLREIDDSELKVIKSKKLDEKCPVILLSLHTNPVFSLMGDVPWYGKSYIKKLRKDIMKSLNPDDPSCLDDVRETLITFSRLLRGEEICVSPWYVEYLKHDIYGAVIRYCTLRRKNEVTVDDEIFTHCLSGLTYLHDGIIHPTCLDENEDFFTCRLIGGKTHSGRKLFSRGFALTLNPFVSSPNQWGKRFITPIGFFHLLLRFPKEDFVVIDNNGCMRFSVYPDVNQSMYFKVRSLEETGKWTSLSLQTGVVDYRKEIIFDRNEMDYLFFLQDVFYSKEEKEKKGLDSFISSVSSTHKLKISPDFFFAFPHISNLILSPFSSPFLTHMRGGYDKGWENKYIKFLKENKKVVEMLSSVMEIGESFFLMEKERRGEVIRLWWEELRDNRELRELIKDNLWTIKVLGDLTPSTLGVVKRGLKVRKEERGEWLRKVLLHNRFYGRLTSDWYKEDRDDEDGLLRKVEGYRSRISSIRGTDELFG